MRNKFLILFALGCALFFTISCMLFGRSRGPLLFQPEVLPAGQVGVPYDARILITGNVTPAGDFSVSDGALPAGLSLETLKGENAARISGTPKEAGSFRFKVFVWCYGTNVSGQTGEKEFVLVVKK